MSLIRVANLRKVFRRPAKPTSGRLAAWRRLLVPATEEVAALEDLSFEVQAGELVGYIGQNGAGKSTTIKLLTGVLAPTSGVVEVAGRVPWREREQNALAIGVVFGHRSQLWWDLPLVDSFRVVARLYGVPAPVYQRNLAYFTELLGLEELLHVPVRLLSLGQRMRGDLVAAMLYEPRILLLDEPTIGLDVLARERIRTCIQEVNRARGTTVLLTTHDLRDVERLCRRVVLIDRGQALYDGTVDDLKARAAPHRVLVATLAATDAGAVEAPPAEVVRRAGPRVWLRFDPRQVPVAQLIGSLAARYPLTDMSIEEPDLEQVVRQIYEQQAAGARRHHGSVPS